ncbi:VWA domain-containing protein [Photobacterium carnosum]|uniref:vWA domain-containing protein n=1 Tax=Photobacterium carnosum TaxID=2023717 RepID=UPI001E4CC77B|nr:VWA domain-containing protein [Photobacterium carnosum]MCD9553447.1 VWA domain-containing protein [Photobacterium carnosum]
MSQSILNSLPLYIGAISNDLNVDVTFSGSGAYCAPVGSKWQINIPLFDVDNAEARAAAYAYALHECGHINYTNFAVLKDLINTQKSKSEISLKKRISNIFEDTYIERELSKEYAGAYKRLSEMRTWLQDEDEKKNPDASNLPLSSQILNFIYTYSFFAANNYTCYKALLDENEVLLVEQLGNDAVLELKSVLNGVKQLASSQDCMDLTDRVYDILEKLKDVIQDQQQQQDQQGGDDSEDDTAQGDSDSGDSQDDDSQSDDSQSGNTQGDDDSQDDQSGDSQSGDSQGDDDSQDDQGDDSQSGDTQGDDNNQDKNADNNNSSDSTNMGDQGYKSDDSTANQKPLTQEQVDDAIDALNDIISGNAELPNSDAGDALAEKLGKQSEDDQASGKVKASDYTTDSKVNSAITYRSLKGNSLGAKTLHRIADTQSVFVRQRLQGLIAAKQRKVVSRKSAGKRMIGNAGTRMAQGDYKVFRQELTRKLTNTAITILLDDSGSMKNEKGQVAASATLALIKALEPINFVSTSVETFGTESSSNIVYKVKDFNESANQCADRLSEHLAYGGGYTPLLTGLWSGLRSISQRKEARKILIVITDGEPDERPRCTELINRIRTSQGVEVFGIGIGDANTLVKPLFGEQYAVSIKKIDQLASEIFKLSEQILFS